jgi:hypothetical protein
MSTPCAWSDAGCPIWWLFPPQEWKTFHEAVLDELLGEPVVSSRGRRNPRKVKRKMSNYPVRPPFEPLPRRVRFQDRIRIIK